MLLIDHADNISQNIKETLVLYAGSNNNNKLDILSEELANKFKNISNLIKQNESVLQKETGKYSPSLETIPEDSIPKLSPAIVYSSTELFAKLENSFNELEQFTDKILIDAGKSYVQQANINPKSNTVSRSSSIDSGIGSSQEELSTTFGKSGSTNLIEALDLAQAKILSNSNTAQDKLTATKELQKSIQQKEVNNERLTQEEIDNIYKTLGIFEEIKEYEKSENSRDPRLLNKNYYKLTDPRTEHRTHTLNRDDTSLDIIDDNSLEWDDEGMPAPFQKSYGAGNVLNRLKEAVDDYISELQNEKLSKDISPKQVEAITHPMQEAIPTPPALSWNTHPIFGDTIKFLKRFKEEIDKFPQDYTKASTIPL
ncbi:hypothetical protein RAS_07470 [Rickettsia asiatica]|uniref:Uncharacterized protein n=1 Tax=Rickettsia asiatica TaxID=238800 RepID=A0A510G7F3_9RICK|nr:hypothetical protein [Rickettsia asiatica]BBJ31638.1 hypothetical protein RAS_07470 [Rickettsia asiatica]